MKNLTKNKVAVSTAVMTAPALIPLNWLKVSYLNPRNQHWSDVSALSKDIAARGLDQPLILRMKMDGTYEIIMGCRRYMAIKQIRGSGGYLYAGEFLVVDWSDEKCMRALMMKDKTRTDLSFAEEAVYYSNVWLSLSNNGVTPTPEMVAAKLGMNAVRVKLILDYQTYQAYLPKVWRNMFFWASNLRVGEVYGEYPRVITLAHWQWVRPFLSLPIAPSVLRVMNQCAKYAWTPEKFKAALEALNSTGKATAMKVVRERDPEAEPNYRGVLKGLRAATVKLGRDNETAKLIAALIVKIEKLVKDNAADGGKKARKAA